MTKNCVNYNDCVDYVSREFDKFKALNNLSIIKSQIMLQSKFILSFVIFIFCTIVFSSCLSIDRNIKINKDGSGEESMKITFQKEFYEIMSSMTALMDSTRKQGYLDSLYNDDIFLSQTRQKYDSIPGINLISLTSEKGSDSSNSLIIRYNFDSVKKIGESLENVKKEGDNSISKAVWNNKDNKIFFEYLYEQSPGKNIISDSSESEMESLSTLFDGGGYNITIDFPFNVISSNAVSVNGNTLTWKYSMPDIIKQGKLKLEAVLEK